MEKLRKMITFYMVGDKLLELDANDLVVKLLEAMGKTKTGELVEITDKDLQRVDQIISEATTRVNKIRQSLDPETKKVICFVTESAGEGLPE
jgi:hypothetical protein